MMFCSKHKNIELPDGAVLTIQCRLVSGHEGKHYTMVVDDTRVGGMSVTWPLADVERPTPDK